MNLLDLGVALGIPKRYLTSGPFNLDVELEEGWTVEPEEKVEVMIDPSIDQRELINIMSEDRRKEVRPKEIVWSSCLKKDKYYYPNVGETVFACYMKLVDLEDGGKYGRWVTIAATYQGEDPWTIEGNTVLEWSTVG